MSLFISGKVLRNLNDFHRVTRKEPPQGDVSRHGTVVYQAIINKKTGDIRFIEYFKKLDEVYHRLKEEGLDEDDWKIIRLTVDERKEETKKSFSMKEENDEELREEELEPLAKRVTHETLRVLNQKGEEIKKHPRKGRLEQAVLADLSTTHTKIQNEPIEENEAWMGTISRKDAEILLQGKSPGTYLFRQGDATTEAIGERLSQEKYRSLLCYVLTLVEQDNKFTDFLILIKEDRWVIYHDMPEFQLEEKGYQDIEELLSHLREKAKYPFHFSPL